MSVKEMAALMRGMMPARNAPDRARLDALMRRFPDSDDNSRRSSSPDLIPLRPAGFAGQVRRSIP
jgi:hypothetical protein